MNKIYYLKTCDTCKRILKQIKNIDQFQLQDIKEQEITVKQLEEMHRLTGSYEKLFSKRAKLYKEMGLKDETLTENDFKRYILEHYTFLARPVIIYNEKIFVGNSPKNIERMLEAIN
ncbi:Arsenate reductase, glutaredoxin family [Paenimyroides aquimaris]|uniref:Arsenate reductase, glutaredoxin family n=1 Tax=Paenimyroides marinum TaxID=1159016 RepID=A0A1H6LI24_9FLAO|nr:ArsC/Spx/MgsR family protein [Paenimyroides aquimaris]SEH88187.1 Arsenate reductase, glutaredoxin family [Paenimyroides aquimaris]